jgi:hypothetical protein
MNMSQAYNSLEIEAFEEIEPGLGEGWPAPEGWLSVTLCPMLILVGLTSVGKSVTLEELAKNGVRFGLLPDRRILTDRLIIDKLLAEEGRPNYELPRIERYPYMMAYRERFPGGMAHALSRLLVDPAQYGPLLVFNGLRGENEVRYAVEALPLVRFVVLDAPDAVRVERQLLRNDPHDRGRGTGPIYTGGRQQLPDFAALGVPEASQYISPSQEKALLELVYRNEVDSRELRNKLKILVNDRRSYDPEATKNALLELAPRRTLVIDTTVNNPEQVAQLIIARFNLGQEGKENHAA